MNCQKVMIYILIVQVRRQFVKDKTEVDINEKHLVNSAWVCLLN